MDDTQQAKQDHQYATFSDQQPLSLTFSYSGWIAIAISLDMSEDEEAAELLAKVPSDFPGLDGDLEQELTIAEWRYIASILHSDLGRWQPTMADDIDAALAADGWVD